MRFSIALIFVAALVAVAPEVAMASGSGINQYVEQVPGAGGNHTAGHGGSGNSLPPGTQQRLNSDGAAGQATAGLANQTAPKGARHHGGKKNGSSSAQRGRAGLATANASSGGGGSGSGGGSGGIGIVLPLILVLSLLAAVGYGLYRRGVFRNFDLSSVFNRRGDVGG